MDYEKKYKNALELAKDYFKANQKLGELEENDMLSDIFPELKESEDERIRKELLAWLKSTDGQTLPIDRYNAAIAWLEKQDEQKPTIIIPRFRVGDEIKTTNEAPLTITDITDSGYWSEDLFICSFENSTKWELVEQKPADKVEPKFHEGDWVVQENIGVYKVIEVCESWYEVVNNKDKHYSIGFDKEYMCHLYTIQDAKDGDVLYSPCLSLLWIFKNRDSVYCGCNLSYNNGAFCVEGYFEMPTDAIPATKEQNDTLMKAMTDAGWEFDFDKKELKKISQRMVSAEAKEAMYDKPTDEEMKEALRTEYEKGRADAIAEMQKGWSEEDERMFEQILQQFMTANNDCKLHNASFTYDKEISFLKSLKGRVQPKQEWNEEDDLILETIIDHIIPDKPFIANGFTDEELVTWLKSLRPQNRWKPSNEQMKALNDLNLTGNISYAGQGQVLIELYNDLKRLLKI